MDIRVGVVSAVDVQQARVRVVFDDLTSDDSDALMSDWLPVCQQGSFGNFGYWLPKVDAQVVCVFHRNAAEVGFVVGTVYSLVDVPPNTGEGIWYQQFADGTVIGYNGSQVVLSTPGTVRIQGGSVEIDGDTVLNGSLVVSNDLTASGIDMVTHVHGGVTTGGGSTGGPI